MCVRHGFDRAQVLREDNPFLERLDHFFVIEPVRRRIDHALAVRDGHAAPGADERHEVRRLAGRRRARAFRADEAAVAHVLVEQFQFFRVVARAQARLAELGGQRLVTLHGLLDQHRVVRHQLGGGVDRGQPAADHDRRQPRLQVRQRAAFERAGQLQRHQEIARLPDPAD